MREKEKEKETTKKQKNGIKKHRNVWLLVSFILVVPEKNGTPTSIHRPH
jgi:hypothetical protein